MARQGESDPGAELKELWEEWTSVVELFARRRRARRNVDPREYEALHKALGESLHSLVETADQEEKAYFQNLEHLALPWVSPQSFRTTDRGILEDVLRRCRQVEQELGGRSWVLPDLRRPTRLFFSLTACAAAMFFLWTALRAWAPILDQGRTWSEAFRLCMQRTSYVHNLLLPAVIVVFTSSFVISRTARH
ncbi:MAG TPA: hypothetical protein VGZ22_03285 [Isosphaeraceae bacterium]|jgi:hypothetical protein|nr:hypothetical protein [Isosphaeraceae bacterium]